jgi:Mrp family chromosome partitioning ATPase
MISALKFKPKAFPMPPLGAPATPAPPPANGPVDLSAEMQTLLRSLGPSSADRGRVIQFVSAASGEGTSTIAREFALCAAQRSRRPVWLIDLDVFGLTQQRAAAKQTKRFGELGKPAAATPDGSVFFAVQPTAVGEEEGRQSRYLSARPAAKGKLWITRFHPEKLEAGQSVTLSRWPAYWNALRAHAEFVVIDAPAADRSTAAMTLAPVADLNVMVVAAEAGDARGPAALKEALEQAGGRMAGLVFNRAQASAPAFLTSLF